MIFQQKTLKTKNQFHLLKIKPILQITTDVIWQILPEKPVCYRFLIHLQLTFDNSNCF